MNVLDYETQCKLQLLGGHVHWGDTPIQETEWAKASDPLRHGGRLPDGWWKRTEPHYGGGKEVIVITTRDNKAQENDELEPGPGETTYAWLARVSTRGGTSNPFWQALHAYAQRFPQHSPARSTLDARLIRSFLKNIRETKGAK